MDYKPAATAHPQPPHQELACPCVSRTAKETVRSCQRFRTTLPDKIDGKVTWTTWEAPNNLPCHHFKIASRTDSTHQTWTVLCHELERWKEAPHTIWWCLIHFDSMMRMTRIQRERQVSRAHPFLATKPPPVGSSNCGAIRSWGAFPPEPERMPGGWVNSLAAISYKLIILRSPTHAGLVTVPFHFCPPG